MQRILITFLFVTMLAICGQRAHGFALLGPRTDMAGLPAGNGDTWQTPDIGYDFPGSDVGTPKRFGQGYRRNIPVMYYSFNESFSGFFGAQGEQAVISAMNILNNTFTNNSHLNLDGYSLNLNEFPDNSQSMNLTAESLALTDVKSVTLFLMVEQLGLAEPERYVWTLHDRFLNPIPGAKCPEDMLYLVIQRNYAFVPSSLTQIQDSSYINDTLYTYSIAERCVAPNPLSVTIPMAVDPFADTYTAVAGLGHGLGVTTVTAPGGVLWTSSEVGGFYNGLTRDDVGGLRYLMSSNNIVFEDTFPQSLLEDTDTNNLQLLQTSDLGALLSFAQTNPPSVVSNAFPGIVIDRVTHYFTVVSNPVISAYFTNFPGSQVGVPPTLVIKTNGYTFTPQTNYVYTFDNVVIVHEHTNTIAQLTTVSLKAINGAQAGTSIITNTTVKTIVLTNIISGDYYIVPPNSCGLNFVQTLLANNRAGSTTNVIATATNTLTGFVGSESIVTYFTNNWYTFYQCNLETSPPAFYQGVGRIRFVRVADENLDSLTGFYITPITNTYSMVWENRTNGQDQLGTRTFQRIVTQPDFMFAGADMASPNIPQIGVNLGTRNVNFDINNLPQNQAGPGVIFPPTTITFNTVEDIFGNGSLAANNLSTNEFLSEATQGSLLAWGSFDGSTNPPIVYPNGTSLQNLENELVLTVSPSTLPDGTNGVPYPTTTFSATGGNPPYMWSMAGTQLPPGLAFTTNAVSAVIFGTPNASTNGVFDFTIQLTDSQNRTANLGYSINIH